MFFNFIPLKIEENERFSLIFKSCKKGKLASKGLLTYDANA